MTCQRRSAVVTMSLPARTAVAASVLVYASALSKADSNPPLILSRPFAPRAIEVIVCYANETALGERALENTGIVLQWLSDARKPKADEIVGQARRDLESLNRLRCAPSCGTSNRVCPTPQ